MARVAEQVVGRAEELAALDDAVAAQLDHNVQRPSRAAAGRGRAESLSERELEVARLLVDRRRTARSPACSS